MYDGVALNIHLLETPCLSARDSVSKLDTRWSVLSGLRELRRATAEHWLAATGAAIGAESSSRVDGSA